MKQELIYEPADIKRAIKADAEGKYPGMVATVSLEIDTELVGYAMGEHKAHVIKCNVSLKPRGERVRG